MAILSYHKSFVPFILDGIKNGTIRRLRKYPIKPGEKLYLYTGLRTKHTKKVGEAVCKAVYRIRITSRSITVWLPEGRWHLKTESELDAFAVCDGFWDWKAMKAWWIKTHAKFPFEGIWIKWNQFRKA